MLGKQRVVWWSEYAATCAELIFVLIDMLLIGLVSSKTTGYGLWPLAVIREV